MFLDEDAWKRAYDAADARLELAVAQGYITYIGSEIRRGIACDIVSAVVRSTITVDDSEVSDGDILDDFREIEKRAYPLIEVEVGQSNGETSE